ncbi:MAG: hypothetical protein ACOYO1_14350 [Bacteroidales bacterium]
MKVFKTDILLILFLFLIITTSFGNSFGQIANIIETKLKYSNFRNKRFEEDEEIGRNNFILFPSIKTGNLKTEKKINHTIFTYLRYDSIYESHSVKKTIKSCVREGLINMKYNVSFNRNGILSLQIEYFHCGANCWTNKIFLNFNLTNGELLTLKDIVKPNKIQNIKDKVSIRKRNKLLTFADSLVIQFDTITNKDMAEPCQEVLKELEKCNDFLSLEQFKVDENNLSFYISCFFAYYLSPYEPELFINFDFRNNFSLFRPEFLKQFF